VLPHRPGGADQLVDRRAARCDQREQRRGLRRRRFATHDLFESGLGLIGVQRFAGAQLVKQLMHIRFKSRCRSFENHRDAEASEAINAFRQQKVQRNL
jgi:hypothetical protein